ncbi:hypothetical protein F4821DRAFT_253384 [Hypoxylon rubiginosum]|uniref:Uncharacterized protein n=1 Tax=Hypoxylon rubiginosum TaxID=110542 RepID=A0ACC0DKN8_9PEZI|nr:hypothetical protein F4821DRAFT_253384 [Hypoxylon rubiginosum]
MVSANMTHSLGKRSYNPMLLGVAFGVFFAIGLVALFIGWMVGCWRYRRQKKQDAADVEAQPPIQMENRTQGPPPAPAPAQLSRADFDSFRFANARATPLPPTPAHTRQADPFDDENRMEDVDLSDLV